MDHVLNWLWQGLAIALATFVLLRLLERSRAAQRFVLCWAALLTVLLLPAIAVWPAYLSTDVPIQPAVVSQATVLSVPHAWWTSGPLMIALGVLWFALFTVRLSDALLKLRSARAACRPFPAAVESRLRHWTRLSGSGRRTRLALSEGTGSAAVLGCGSPVIAVSPALVQLLSDDELDQVVVHEWAHVQRRDDLLNLAQLAAHAFAGWHPSVWWLDRRLLLEREMACDETVVALTGSPKAYASSLTRVAFLSANRRARLASVGALSSPALTRRVVRILARANPLSSGWSLTAAGVAVVVLFAMSFTVGGMRLVRIAPPSSAFQPRAQAAMPKSVQGIHSEEAASADQRGGARESANGPVPSRATASPRSRRTTVPPSLPAPPETPSTSPVASRTAALVVEETNQVPISSTSLVLAVNDHPGAGTALAPTDVSPYSAATTQSSTDVRPASPWDAAAGAGVAIGRTSQRAGVATATFFTRIGKQIGRSF